MEILIEYIKPELLILIPVLYFIGQAVKGTEVDNKYIPFILGSAGILLCVLYVLATCKFDNIQCIAIGAFTAIVQGILVAGASVYFNEMKKQAEK